jgi:hypothetical protein
MKNLKQFIQESFDTRPARWNRTADFESSAGGLYFFYDFKIGSDKYNVTISEWLTGQFEGSFSLANDFYDSFDLTGTGNQYKVLVTVIDCFRDFLESPQLEKYGKFKVLKFSAAKYETNYEKQTGRAGVYKRLINKFLPKSKYFVDIQDEYDEIVFKIAPK